MEGYDILMLAVLIGTTLFGAVKGMAWQLATIASLFASYFFSYYFSDSLVATGWFGDTAPWNRFAAMLTLYVVSGLFIWTGFRFVHGTIERFKIKDFDRQLGGLFGFVKGVLFCVLITFFVVTLLPKYRDYVINTHSGRVIARLLHKADVVLPAEIRSVLDPYIKSFEAGLNGQYVGDDPAARWPLDGRPVPERPWSIPTQQPLPSGRGPLTEYDLPQGFQQPRYSEPAAPQPYRQPGFQPPAYSPPYQAPTGYPNYPQSYYPMPDSQRYPGPQAGWYQPPVYGPERPRLTGARSGLE